MAPPHSPSNKARDIRFLYSLSELQCITWIHGEVIKFLNFYIAITYSDYKCVVIRSNIIKCFSPATAD